MAFPDTTCPQCGQPTSQDSHEQHERRCALCRGDQHRGDQPRAGSRTPSEWLEVGRRFAMRIAPQDIGLAHDADTVEVELEMAELWEDYQTRRVLLAHPLALFDAQGRGLDDERFAAIRDLEFIVEQEQAFDHSEHEVLPDAFADSVRKPLVRREEGDKVVSVFSNTHGLALDEVVEVASSRLNLAQVRGLFLPVLDAVGELHDEGLLHLRLTPWTLRVRDRADAKGLPLDFLRDTMEGGHDFQEPTGLGDEITFSETETLADAPADGGSPFDNEFAASRELDKTRDDLMPLIAADFGGHDEQPADDEADSVGEREGLEVLFDNIDGFFRADGDFDDVPIVRGFSPPEMVGRARAQIGECCDVFNLGMLLYFLVAGQLPPVSVYTRHIPAVPARNLRPSFPPGLQAVIGRATRPDPDERYPDVTSLRRAFERACEVMQTRADLSGPDAPRMQVAVDTHVGIAKARRNPTNQDAVFGASSDDRRFSLVVVADGVSTASYGSGDLASTMLAEEAANAWEELLPSYLMDEAINPTAAIQDILNRANDRIVAYVNEHFLPFRGGPHEVMGSTALVAMLHDGMVTLAALGDSRVYLHRGEAFEQLTTDHNLWTLSILEGVPADNALAMPHGDALARCLGTFIVEHERLHAVNPEPDVFQFPVTKGDTLLLTTDGLVDFAAANMLTAEDLIHQVLVSEPDPALACLELILLANRGGGGDNIGVGIVKFV